jgi:hypothetical protein
MLNRITTGRGLGRSFVLAGVIAGSAVVGLSAANAGECPAGQMKADVRQPATNAAKGVTGRHGMTNPQDRNLGAAVTDL